MNIHTACRILGYEPGDDEASVRKKYHRRMSRIHPDAGTEQGSGKDARELNEAYEVLIKKGGLKKQMQTGSSFGQRESKTEKHHDRWSVQINPNAYTARPVFQYAEDQYGNQLGKYLAAEGKYYWDFEHEDAALFLHSLYRTASHLLERVEQEKNREIPEERRHWAQKELIYLLAGQYTELDRGLWVLSGKQKKDTEERTLFYFPAMLEFTVAGRKAALKEGDVLYPVSLQDHRLYLGKEWGKALGYLSFADDRLYYVLLPMFENREVKIKITVGPQTEKGYGLYKMRKLDLWVRKTEMTVGLQSSRNDKIEEILKKVLYH